MSYLPPVFFADLDDTMFQSARKVPATEMRDLRLVSEALEGNHSFQTLKQQNLFAWLRNSATFIPVTARSTRSFAKIDMPFMAGWRVLGNGAVVVTPGGEIDDSWHQMILAETKKEADTIAELEKSIAAVAEKLEIQVRCPQSIENGIRHSVTVKQDNPNVKIRLNEILDEIRVPTGWVAHLNSNNLAFTVPGVSKRRAVEYVCSKLPDIERRVVFGLGDSLTDIPFMQFCDFFATPTRGQIAETFKFTKVAKEIVE